MALSFCAQLGLGTEPWLCWSTSLCLSTSAARRAVRTGNARNC